LKYKYRGRCHTPPSRQLLVVGTNYELILPGGGISLVLWRLAHTCPCTYYLEVHIGDGYWLILDVVHLLTAVSFCTILFAIKKFSIFVV